MPRNDPLAEFERLFSDDSADAIAKSDELSDHVISIMHLGLDTIEQLILHGDDSTKLNALVKIFPLATKVAERRTDAELNRVVETCRAMFLEMFPERAALESEYAEIEQEFEIPVFSAEVEQQAPIHAPMFPVAGPDT